MADEISFDVLSSEAGTRLDRLLAGRHPDLTRSLAQTLILEGQITLNGVAARPSTRARAGDRVEGRVTGPHPPEVHPEPIPVSIVYQDADVIVVDKPAGLVVHPAAGHRTGTLANALAHLFPATREVGDASRPGIVHRLDKDTSGLMLAALSPRGLQSLQAQIAIRSVGREYLALAAGTVRPPRASIEAPIGRDPNDRQRMAVYGLASRTARTSYRVLEYPPGFSYLEARLHSGRTHQIRVHLAALGHPLAGDTRYGGPSIEGLARQFLHAHRLSFRSPSTDEQMVFESPLPADLASVLGWLGSR